MVKFEFFHSQVGRRGEGHIQDGIGERRRVHGSRFLGILSERRAKVQGWLAADGGGIQGRRVGGQQNEGQISLSAVHRRAVYRCRERENFAYRESLHRGGHLRSE